MIIGEDERWIVLKRFPNYAISSYGRIVNVVTGRLLFGYKPGSFYPRRVNLRHQGETKTLYVHRLVAEAFIEEFTPDSRVYHIDDDYRNNWVGNLGLRDHPGPLNIRIGNREVFSRWLYCKETRGYYASVQEAARELGIHRASIHYVLDGQWEHVRGYTFMWVWEPGSVVDGS